jgi:hypothetical protein
VRDEQHRLLAHAPHGQQVVLHAPARLRVERAEWLVHEHRVGLVDEGADDRDAFLHAARELVRVVLLEALEAHHAQILVGARMPRLG